MSVPQITLHDHPVSSYAMKVRILLREKHLAFTSTPGLGPAGANERLKAVNPRREVPMIEHAGTAVYDSTVIAEYLEDAFPQATPLLPPLTDPAARAHCRLIEDYADTTYEAINWGWGECLWFDRAGAEGSELRAHMRTEAERQTRVVFAWLEAHLSEGNDVTSTSSPLPSFFAGSGHGFSIADAAVVPLVNRSVYYGFPPEPESRLARWFEHVKTRPAVQETFKEFEENVGKMPLAKPAFLSGERQRQYRDYRLEWMIKTGGADVVLDGLKKHNIRFNSPDGTRPT